MMSFNDEKVKHDVEGDRHGPDRGPHRDVAWTLQQVVVSVVTGDPLLHERIDDQQAEDDTHDQCDRNGGRNGVVPEVELPGRPQPDKPSVHIM